MRLLSHRDLIPKIQNILIKPIKISPRKMPEPLPSIITLLKSKSSPGLFSQKQSPSLPIEQSCHHPALYADKTH